MPEGFHTTESIGSIERMISINFCLDCNQVQLQSGAIVLKWLESSLLTLSTKELNLVSVTSLHPLKGNLSQVYLINLNWCILNANNTFAVFSHLRDQGTIAIKTILEVYSTDD